MKNVSGTSEQLPESSWCYFIRKPGEEGVYDWHFHPEYEITFTIKGRGEKFVGDYIGHYNDQDLVVLGPNLPHSWKPDARNSEGCEAHVLWFDQAWVDHLLAGFPEYQRLGKMLDDSRRGVQFSAAVSEKVMPLFLRLKDADHKTRLVLLLAIFNELLDAEYTLLASGQSGSTPCSRDEEQLTAILEDIHNNYRDNLCLTDFAARHDMSVSTLTRYFKRHMNQSFNEYVTQVRIGHACERLICNEEPVASIAENTGFRNLSNFNRQFRRLKNQTPREFKKSFERVA